MNKEQIIKCSWKKLVRIRPIPKRFDGGPEGPELPALDRDWQIGAASAEVGVPLSLHETGHGITLNWDNIREYSSDPVRGDRYGFLLLKVQIYVGGNRIWVEPLLASPGSVVAESESQRKARAILPFKGKTVKLSQMNTGNAVHLLGAVRGSSSVQVLDCTEFSVTVGKQGSDGWSRHIALADIHICLDEHGLELQERHL